MKAITVVPGEVNSVRLDERPEPTTDGTHIVVEAEALGVCGTDREIISGAYGWAPPGAERLVLGHESLGRVIAAPEGSGFAPGDRIVGVVRCPDPVPCGACAAGEWDMCRNGLYTEHGIKALDGFGAERFVLSPSHAIRVPASLGLAAVLLEPASVLAKAWDHVERIGRRTRSWRPRVALITGAGPVGLLGALMAVQRGLEVHVLDRNQAGPKPRLVRALGGTYHVGPLPDDLAPDVILECTGAPAVVLDVLKRPASDGIVCLAGVSGASPPLPFDFGDFNRAMVLNNGAVFGSVNANRAHYLTALRALVAADPAWLAALITRWVPLARWAEAFEKRDGDIKVVLTFGS